MRGFAVFIGFFLCHAVWSIEDGDILSPFYATEENGKRKIQRFEGDYQKIVEEARAALESDKNKFDYSLIAYDGFLTLNSGKKDAIIIEAFGIVGSNEYKVVMALPYKSASSPGGLKIFKPKTLEANVQDVQTFYTEFWNGVEMHEKGAAVWNKYIDQSE